MTQSFKEAYGVLNRHAQTLRNQQEPNIDELLGIVTESVAAYKVCKERIDAVEAALEQALADPAVASSSAPGCAEEGRSLASAGTVRATAGPASSLVGNQDTDASAPV
jgi:exodeoxyribonuclease VII small subunit